MLSQVSRLPSCDFRSRGYRTVATPFFVLKIKKGPTDKNRLGIVIGATAVKNASRRNFWKRKARMNFEKLPDVGNDFLIIFSKNIKDCTAKEFKETFSRATTQ
jgi:ribonuclease P protein component